MKLLFLVMLTFGATCDAQRPSASTRLVADIFRQYDAGVLPQEENGTTTTAAVRLTIDLVLAQLIDVDEKRQTLSAVVWWRLRWRDALLGWEPSEYGGVRAVHVPVERVWRPLPVVYNR